MARRVRVGPRIVRLALRAGFEPAIPGFVGRCLIQFGHRSDAGRILTVSRSRRNRFVPSGGRWHGSRPKGFLGELRQPARTDPAHLAAVLAEIHDALDESPAPATEWPALHEILGADLLARLVGISASSTRRYLEGARATPDAVAARLHFLALVVADLAGAYNDIGVRRWFERPRKRLGGSSPARLLAEGWLPDDDGPSRVRELAAGLASSLAT